MTISEEARVRAKLMLRQPTIDKLRSRQQEDIDQYVSSRLSESAHKSMEMYLDSFKKRKQSKLWITFRFLYSFSLQDLFSLSGDMGSLHPSLPALHQNSRSFPTT